MMDCTWQTLQPGWVKKRPRPSRLRGSRQALYLEVEPSSAAYELSKVVDVSQAKLIRVDLPMPVVVLRTEVTFVGRSRFVIPISLR